MRNGIPRESLLRRLRDRPDLPPLREPVGSHPELIKSSFAVRRGDGTDHPTILTEAIHFSQPRLARHVRELENVSADFASGAPVICITMEHVRTLWPKATAADRSIRTNLSEPTRANCWSCTARENQERCSLNPHPRARDFRSGPSQLAQATRPRPPARWLRSIQAHHARKLTPLRPSSRQVHKL